jgi:CheY-like chemotaxis protein
MTVPILVLEDEPLLRKSMSRVLAQIPETEVDAVGTLAAALTSVRTRQPDLIVADIEVPDGSGIDLLQALTGATVQFIFVSGYIPDYVERLGNHPAVIICEKPMPMRELQMLALAQIEAAKETAASPFTVADYVQLACLGKRSVRIDVEGKDGGHVYIHKGGIWAAFSEGLAGAEAFYGLALMEQGRIQCSKLDRITVDRNVDPTSWEFLLLEAARRSDEADRSS